MKTPDNPYAMVRSRSDAHAALEALGWRATDHQGGWVHLEPPEDTTAALLLVACRALVPELHWRVVGAGFGPTCWGLKSLDDPLDAKVAIITAGSTRPGHPFIVYGRLDGRAAAQLAHVETIEKAAQVVRTHLGLEPLD